jgi:hypothetical protein
MFADARRAILRGTVGFISPRLLHRTPLILSLWNSR